VWLSCSFIDNKIPLLPINFVQPISSERNPRLPLCRFAAARITVAAEARRCLFADATAASDARFSFCIFLEGHRACWPNRATALRCCVGNGARPSIGITLRGWSPRRGAGRGASPAGDVFAVGARRSRQRSRSPMAGGRPSCIAGRPRAGKLAARCGRRLRGPQSSRSGASASILSSRSVSPGCSRYHGVTWGNPRGLKRTKTENRLISMPSGGHPLRQLLVSWKLRLSHKAWNNSCSRAFVCRPRSGAYSPYGSE
jgi:hypothetical protein